MDVLASGRVGIIGAGGIAAEHAAAWNALGAPISVYSSRGAPVFAERFAAAASASLDELIGSCDLIDICTPTPSHPEFAHAAIDAGKPVICEKPLALTFDEARRIADHATAAGVPLLPAHVVRFFPQYVVAKNAVVRGDIGDVAVSRFLRMGEYPTWSPWFADDRLSGGIVLDQMIHDIDLALWISGPVSRVYAVRSGTPAPTSTAQVALTHESGAISYATGVWGAPGTRFETAFSIAGTGGVLEHDTRTETTVMTDLAPPTGDSSARPDSSLIDNPFIAELREFAAAISGEGVARVSAEEAVSAVAVARAAIASIESGRPVDLGGDDS